MSLKDGELCPKHPDDLRRAKDGRCVRCESERRLEYRARNLDKARSKRKATRRRENELARMRHAENPEPRRASVRKYRDANPDHAKESNAKQYWNNITANKARASAWKKDNPERALKNARDWKERNPEKAKKFRNESVRRWHQKNPDRRAAYVRDYQASKLNAVPAWANKFFMKEAYALARIRTNLFGFKWHVDHTVPLKSPLVCGLHCEANLQVIPGRENAAKGNRVWPDMPTALSG